MHVHVAGSEDSNSNVFSIGHWILRNIECIKKLVNKFNR